MAANEKGVGPVVETQLGETGGLQDIVVTAQRRSESLQNVPISVAAFTGETLTQRGLNSTEALQAGVPGLVMTRQISGATPFLRGVGTPTVSAGIESPVATYVDGVYYAESIGSIFSFNNVERVEVLKGPQGTLYGRNSTGGLINVVTRDPRSEFSLEGSVSYANFDQKSLSAYMTGGSGNLSADIAAYVVRQSDGYGRNITTGREVGKEHATYLRSKVLWEPSDQDRFVASFDFSRDRTDLGSAIDAAPDSILTDGQSSTGRSHDIRSDQDPRQNTRTWGANVRYVRDLGWGSFSSLSAYRNVKSAFTLDVDGTATALLPTTTSVVSRSFQQELLLQGKGDRFNWTAGLFVFDVRAGFVPNQFGPSLLPFLNYDVFAIQNTHSYAAFLDGGYKLSDQTTVTAGIRYTIDQREFSGRTVARTGNSEPIGTILTSGAGKKTFKRPSWRLVIDHRFSDAVMAYASYNRGFRSGTFNSGVVTQGAINPENLDSYEIGLKSDLLDRLVRINLAAFRYEYKGIQLTKINEEGSQELLNAANARVSGLDGEVVLAPPISFGELTLTGGASLLDAKYQTFLDGPITIPTGVGGNVGGVADLSGNDMIHAPDWTLSLSGSLTVPVGSGKLNINASYFHSGGFYWEPDNRLRQPAYDIVSAQIGYKFGSAGQYGVRVFGKNLNNAHYSSLEVSTGFGDIASFAPPRTYGVALDFKF